VKQLKEKKAYEFKLEKNLLYERKDVLRFFNQWRQTGVADEMINVSFNRDFYNEEQKDLIKIMNMNRDHANLFIACVPQFQNLDTQIKNLCKIRITVVRRGIGVIQTPNRTIYAKDRWDTSTNEKIEREWLIKGVHKPHYKKLSTFRGMIRFPSLNKFVEKKYQAVKDEKRHQIMKHSMGTDIAITDLDPVDRAVMMLKNNEVQNSMVLDGIALSVCKEPDVFRRAVSNKLKKEGMESRLTEYYVDKNKKKRKVKEQIAEWRSMFKGVEPDVL
jgi:hypothetical protein